MLDLNDFYYFSVIAERRSFSAAADTLGVPKGTLSKRFRALEQALGVRLANRTTRSFTLTEAGIGFHKHTVRVIDAAHGAQQEVQARLSAPIGRVRISCATGFVHQSLVVVLPEFLSLHPKLDLELLTSCRDIDPVLSGFDLALCTHTGALQSSSLVARQVMRIRTVLVASPHFFPVGAPATPEELDGVAGLLLERNDPCDTWQLFTSRERSATVSYHPRLRSNDPAMVRFSALGGLGVAALPLPMCRDDLAAGRLIRVLPDWHVPSDTLSILMPSRQGMTLAVRTAVEFLVDALPKHLADY